MSPQPIEKRVETLEARVTRLEEPPDRVERIGSQIVQMRAEMHSEFSAVGEEMRGRFEHADAAMAALRADVRAGDEETRRYMRILHEDVISRLKTIRKG
jgi:hypothetical protein